MSMKPTLARSRKASKAPSRWMPIPDRKFQARIRELRYGSEVVQGVVTYKAVLSTDNSELLLRPGMTATAEIIVQQVTKALTVPNAALRYSPPARQSSEQKTSLLRRLGILRGRPPFRPASQREEGGPNRRVWILKNGAPVSVSRGGGGVGRATHRDRQGRHQGGTRRHRR